MELNPRLANQKPKKNSKLGLFRFTRGEEEYESNLPSVDTKWLQIRLKRIIPQPPAKVLMLGHKI